MSHQEMGQGKKAILVVVSGIALLATAGWSIQHLWPEAREQKAAYEGALGIQSAEVSQKRSAPGAPARAAADDRVQDSGVPGGDLEFSFKGLEFPAGEIYARHVGAAENGDVYSQYVLYAVLEYCRSAVAEPADANDATNVDVVQPAEVAEPEYAKSIARRKQTRNERCAAMPAKMQEYRVLLQEQEKWYVRARRGSHPLTRMPDFDQPKDAQRSYFKWLLGEDFKEAFVRATVYDHIATFYSLPGTEDVLRSSAWRILWCEANPECEVAEELSLSKRQYPPQQYAEILKIAAALKAGTWGL